ncbi:DUF3558 family protein [Streptomyces sp. NPDC047072]|uniref:DUF3558 family protein n=1 Tax=Streptomyces sp. NPDC047072 TaxID=3154809 RepID=UPI00340C7F46
MSEGTMQRRAERDQSEKRAKRLSRVLVGAAVVPVMLVAAGCSSGSDGDSGSGSGGDTAAAGTGPGASASASAAPTVQAAAYKSLPESCAVLTGKTLGELVPKAAKSGKKGTAEAGTRGSCSWSSLANNGVKGSQFRWLNVSLLRFDSDSSRGSGEQQAQKYYEQQVQDAQAVEGAKNVKSQTVAGTGDVATLVRYDLKKKEGAFKQQTVVTRVENVVVTLDYNGAGLAGDKSPSADSLVKLAEKATKEAVASVSAANGEGAAVGGSASPTPSKSASRTPSSSPSPSKSAAKKS